MALEQAKCSNCSGPIAMVGSMYRCEYCRSAYFPPVQCEVVSDEPEGTTSTTLTTTTQSSSACSSWSTMSTRLPDYVYPWITYVHEREWSEEPRQSAHIQDILDERQRRIEKKARRAEIINITLVNLIGIISIICVMTNLYVIGRALVR